MPSRKEPVAFDLWLKRVLKDQYGQVVREKLPDDLLQLIERAPEH